MNKNLFIKYLMSVSLALLLGGGFSIGLVKAGNDLILEVIEGKKCDIQYSGDDCIAGLKITNNAGKILDGEASLHIGYNGICEDDFFDGIGIKAYYQERQDNNWLNFSDWENGTATVSGFEIAKGETYPKLKIETAPNLCPGIYTFSLSLGGEYVVIGGGGGTYYYTIIASAGANGFISPAGSTSLAYGSDQIYMITPNTGYEVADVLVDGVSKGAITTYTFNNVSSNHTISAIFSAVLPPVVAKTGDVNSDNKIDEYDFSILMSQWGQTGINVCDFNNDSVVNEYDFAIMMANWGN